MTGEPYPYISINKRYRDPPGYMPIKFDPIIDEPVLMVKGSTTALVIADIHLGIEWDLYRSGISIPSRMKYGLGRILGLVKQESPDRIVLLGDLKHNVPQTSWQEKDEIPYFLDALAEHASIDIFPGNHDGGIEHLVPKRSDIRIHPIRGAIIDEVGYFHGHAWPDPALLKVRHIVTAHNHPCVRFTDSLGYSMTEQCWIRTRLNMAILTEQFRDMELLDRKGKDIPELIVVPAFNELCGGVAFNGSIQKELLGPMFTSGAVDTDNAEVYLLDGTHLGILKNIRKMKESMPLGGKRKRRGVGK